MRGGRKQRDRALPASFCSLPVVKWSIDSSARDQSEAKVGLPVSFAEPLGAEPLKSHYFGTASHTSAEILLDLIAVAASPPVKLVSFGRQRSRQEASVTARLVV